TIKGECVAIKYELLLSKLVIISIIFSCHVIENDNSGSSIRINKLSNKQENNKIITNFFSPEDKSINLNSFDSSSIILNLLLSYSLYFLKYIFNPEGVTVNVLLVINSFNNLSNPFTLGSIE